MDVLARNNVTVTGLPDGPAMVFAHGFGCDQAMWRFVAPDFEVDHKVVLFDYVGAGGSDLASYDSARYHRLEGYAADLVEVLDALELTSVVFVGHSVSAMIGVLAAISRPELFAQLVMIGPSPRYVDTDGYVGGFSRAEIEELLDTMEANYLGWSAHMAPAIMGAPSQPELGQELTQSFCRTDPTIAREFARATFLSDNRDDLPRVTVPSLVLQCRSDVIAPMPVGEYVAAHLPDAELVVLDATGHCPHLSAPGAVVAEMRRYLAGR